MQHFARVGGGDRLRLHVLLIRRSRKQRKWGVPSENVPPDENTAKGLTTIRWRYGVGCPSRATVSSMAVSDFGSGVGRKPSRKQPTGEGGRKGSIRIVHLLRSGSTRLVRVGKEAHAGTLFVTLRGVCARLLHAGASGLPHEKAYRPEMLHRLLLRVGGGKSPPPPDGAC